MKYIALLICVAFAMAVSADEEPNAIVPEELVQTDEKDSDKFIHGIAKWVKDTYHDTAALGAAGAAPYVGNEMVTKTQKKLAAGAKHVTSCGGPSNPHKEIGLSKSWKPHTHQPHRHRPHKHHRHNPHKHHWHHRHHKHHWHTRVHKWIHSWGTEQAAEFAAKPVTRNEVAKSITRNAVAKPVAKHVAKPVAKPKVRLSPLGVHPVAKPVTRNEFTDLYEAEAKKLKIHKATQGEVVAGVGRLAFHGKFGKDKNSGNSKLLLTGTKKVLLEVDTTPEAITYRFLGKPTLVLKKSSKPSTLKRVVQEINNHLYDYQHDIRRVSHGLGLMGLNGRDAPVTLWMHTLAATDFKEPKEAMIEESDRFGSLNYNNQCHHDPHLALRQHWFNKGTYDTGKFQNEPFQLKCAKGLRDATNIKCDNKCFGMCGPGDLCWPHVCGNCLANRGCWEHDAYCSCCGPKNLKCLAVAANNCNTYKCAAQKKFCGTGEYKDKANKVRTEFNCACGGKPQVYKKSC